MSAAIAVKWCTFFTGVTSGEDTELATEGETSSGALVGSTCRNWCMRLGLDITGIEPLQGLVALEYCSL